MTLAVAASTPTQPTSQQTVPIVILGTDAVLAALPATPVQLAHACMRAGFANVIPASWGDELIASAVLRKLPQFGNGPAIQCSCPIVAHRLLTVGGDLRPVLLPLVPPPIAVARYIRALAKPTRARITYVGSCPGAVDESIDIRMTADALIAMLAERDIVLEEQPRVFESIIPADRRRFRSQPGGLPTAEALWSELGSRTLIEVETDDFVTEIAQHLLTGKNVLIDASARLGCACAGATAHASRGQVIALEPPRATSPVVDDSPPIDLELPIPAAPRTPVDVVAVSSAPASHSPISSSEAFGNRISPVRASGPIQEPRASRTSTPAVQRPVASVFPVARDTEGKSLPRAYVARRRSSPKGITVTLPSDETSAARLTAPVAPPVVLAPVAAPPAVITPAISAPLPAPVPSPAPAVVVVPAPLSSAVETPVTVVASEPSNVATAPRPDTWSAPAPAPAPASRPSSASPHRRTASEQWAPPPPAPTISRGQIVLILVAVAMIAICASTVVAVIVGRSVSASAASSQFPR